MKIRKFSGFINVIPQEKYWKDGKLDLTKEEQETLRNKPYMNFVEKTDKNGKEFYSGSIRVSSKDNDGNFVNTDTIYVNLNSPKEMNRLLAYTLSNTPVTITATESEGYEGKKLLSFVAVEDNRKIDDITKNLGLDVEYKQPKKCPKINV